MNVPDSLQYAPSHEWFRPDGTVGITDHAQAELTDIVYVELPKVGSTVAAGSTICVVESVKAASDIYSPVSGTIIAVNSTLTSNPALLNTDPFGDGWIFQIQIDGQSSHLLTAAQYRTQIGAPSPH